MDLKKLLDLSRIGWLSGGKETRCGKGSTLESTKLIRCVLPKVINELNIKTILDIGCGDLNWIHDIIPDNVEYAGVDWVLKDQSIMRYKQNITLIEANIFDLNFTPFDLIICKDVMIHFDLDDALLLYKMILESGSRYLYATSYDNPTNQDNDTSVYWKINLDIEPFKKMVKLQSLNIENDKYLNLYQIK